MSTTTKPVWRTATGHKEDDFDAIWLYENTWEWTFSEENGIVTLHYLSSKVMPERKQANKVSQEKQFCRNCGKRDSVFFQEDMVHFWEPGLCMECHQLSVIGIRYDVFTGKRIEPARDYTIDRCARCNKVRRITGNYHGTLINGLTYASQWCSCPVTKHDGKLDTDDDYRVTFEGRQVCVNDGYDAYVYLDPKQALSLLAWLEENRTRLEELAKEQAE